MAKCIYCNEPLVWGGDENGEDVMGEEYKGRTVSNYSCPNCGAEYSVISPKGEGE